MKKCSLLIAVLLSCLSSAAMCAQHYSVPIQLDYRLVKAVLFSSLYTDKQHSAKLWQDKQGCSSVILSALQLDGYQGQLRLRNKVHAQVGALFAGQCMTLLKWVGTLETWQQPRLSDDRKTLSLPITHAVAYDQHGQKLAIEKLESVLLQHVQPKLATVNIDLRQQYPELVATLLPYINPTQHGLLQETLDSLVFKDIQVNEQHVTLNLAFDTSVPSSASAHSAPFTQAEQQRWQKLAPYWEKLLTNALTQIAQETHSSALHESLLTVVKKARNTLQQALVAQHTAQQDPVRLFFLTSWQQLAPKLIAVTADIDNDQQRLRYLSFIAALDIVYQLVEQNIPLGMEISSDGLRRLGRLLVDSAS
jgi:hypothetical protein